MPVAYLRVVGEAFEGLPAVLEPRVLGPTKTRQRLWGDASQKLSHPLSQEIERA
jgi:hypothetical protein